MAWLDELFGATAGGEAGGGVGIAAAAATDPRRRFDALFSGAPFPSEVDVATARGAGFGGEKPYQAMLRGETAYQQGDDSWDAASSAVRRNAPKVPKEYRDMVMAGQLAANRSALASLGFDPNRIVY